MIWTNSRIFIIDINFIELHKLVQFCLGIFDGPIAMDASIHVQGFGLLHFALLLGTIEWIQATLVAIVVWPICLAQILRPKATLNQMEKHEDLIIHDERM